MLLEELRVLATARIGERFDYSLRSIEEGGPKDFLILRSLKRASISFDGNRAVRVRTRVMAFRNGVASRPCGSLVWSNKAAAPKFRLGPAQRSDLVSEKVPSPPRFEVVQRENNDMVFRLNFEPPLVAGEIVDYSSTSGLRISMRCQRKRVWHDTMMSGLEMV
jgi:hypothetical protein